MIWQNYLVSVILVLFDLYHETICLTIIAMLVANDLILVSPNSRCFVQTKLDARNIPNVHFDVKDDYSVLAQRSYAF